jgi:prepilin-type N-terminal cleavage/methylation domain-containing protein
MKRRPQGFTLIETLAALLLLAVAVPPMLWALRDAHVQRVGPMQVSTARWLAVEKLEDVIADRHAPSRGYGYLIAGNYPLEPAVPGYADFSRRVTLTETGPDLVAAGVGYMKVAVEVSWTDATGTPRSQTVSTVVTEYLS